MNPVWIGVVMGLVEGLTEYIPVSSTGHLILTGHLLGFTGDRAAAFSVFIQFGAVLAVVWESRRTLVEVVSDIGAHGTARQMAVNLALGFVPSAAVGLLLHDTIERVLFAPVYVAWGLLIGGAGILLVESRAPRPAADDVRRIPWRMALGVGLAQCLALFPGVSRSAATILGGMAAGLSRRTATEFSFFLALPTLGAASAYDLWHWRDILTWNDAPLFAAGFATSFVAGLASVKFLIRYVATHDFRPFAWYRIALALVAFWLLRGA